MSTFRNTIYFIQPNHFVNNTKVFARIIQNLVKSIEIFVSFNQIEVENLSLMEFKKKSNNHARRIKICKNLRNVNLKSVNSTKLVKCTKKSFCQNMHRTFCKLCEFIIYIYIYITTIFFDWSNKILVGLIKYFPECNILFPKICIP